MQESQSTIVMVDEFDKAIVGMLKEDIAADVKKEEQRRLRKRKPTNRAFLDGKCVMATGTIYGCQTNGWRRLTAKTNKYGSR